jgi:glycosyltransferase involved in cell wall biosynthesis
MQVGRIAYVISTRGVAGAERFLAALVQEGVARGWEQIVLNPFAGDATSELERLFRPVRYKARRCDNLLSVPMLRRWLREELRAFRPDIVHVMLFHALLLVATLRRTPGQTWLLTNVYGEGIANRGPSRPMQWYGRRRQDLDRLAGTRFDRVVGISRAVEDFMLSSYGYPATKVLCIPLGWEGQPLPRERDERPPTIVCVANFRPEKGHDVLLDAFAVVKERIPDARLVLVGHGELQDEVDAKVRALALNGSVHVTGFVPEVWPYLADADVFAIASASEAYGIAIAEAMAAGLPVVASDVGGIPELVKPGVTGELFTPGDSAGLASHLIRMLSAPELRARMSPAAREAAEPLRLSNTLPRYFEVCEELVRVRDAEREVR